MRSRRKFISAMVVAVVVCLVMWGTLPVSHFGGEPEVPHYALVACSILFPLGFLLSAVRGVGASATGKRMAGVFGRVLTLCACISFCIRLLGSSWGGFDTETVVGILVSIVVISIPAIWASSILSVSSSR